MAGVLSKIVKTDAQTKEHLESIDTTLQSLYELQLGTEKREAKESKRNKQRDKRKKGDSFLDKLNLSEKEKKDQRKGLFESLKNIFKNLGSGLLGGFGGLLGKLFKIGGPISRIITGAFSTLFKAGGSVMTGLAKGLGMLLGSPWFWKAATIAGMSVSVVKGSKNIEQHFSQLMARTGKTKSGVVFEELDVKKLSTKFLNDQFAEGITGGEEHNKKKQQYQDLILAMRAGKGQRDDIENKQRERDEAIAERERIKSSWNAKIAEEKDERKKNNMINSRDVALVSINARINKLNELLRTLNFNHRQNTKIITNLADGLITDQEIVQQQLSDGRRSSIPDHLKGKVTPATLIQQMSSGFGSAEDYEKKLNEKNAEGYQSGGPIKVPGSGSGDKVPMMLPQGSFVMNRNAASMGYQTGGIPKFQSGGMIPTLLEPGEHVYGPGQWDASHVMMNNQIPRFQTGGFVGTSRSQMVDTGDVDGSGRPILLAPGAAAAWKKMKNAGMPMNPGDVTSVWRNEAEYHRLKTQGYKPASNSYHNHGEAADIHGEMNKWIRANGAQYGWVANDYSGSHGGHFEFKGPGVRDIGSNQDPDGGAGASTTTAGGISGFMSSLGGIGGALGQFMSGALGSLGDIFGPEFGGVIDALFGGGAMVGGASGGGGSGPVGTGPVDMGADVNEKLLNTARLAMDAGFTKEQAKVMAAIAGGESTFNNRAHNPNRATGDNSYGLWQINMIDQLGVERRRNLGLSSNEDLFDPATNARAAKAIFDSQGFGAWGAYKDGNAAKYMNAAKALKLAEGGRVGRAPQMSVNRASQQMATRRHLAKSSGRNIQVVPIASKGSPSSNSNPGAQNQPPDLSAYPVNVIAMDLGYDGLSINGVV